MTRLKTQLVQSNAEVTPRAFGGLLAGLESGPVLSWGLLDVVSLRLAPGSDPGPRGRFATPGEHLELVDVPDYGTVFLRNTSVEQPLIVPMHSVFFQPDAQNHATSRTLVLAAEETLKATDCLCVQAAQGGLLQEAQQRFLILPLGLRHHALSKRNVEGYSRMWDEIDDFTRQFGVATGGHLERILRPNFSRLLPLRHALEITSDQVGGAYFVAGRLAGVEVTPHNACWRELGPILAMYCYGPAALRAERRGYERISEPLDLDDLINLDDLTARLWDVRAREATDRADIVQELATLRFDGQVDEDRYGMRTVTLGHDPWVGQMVQDGPHIVYASVFRDVVPQLKHDGRGTSEAN